jgi:hypothetical protein
MASDDLAAEIDRLWLQVKPLYDALHAFHATGSSGPTVRAARLPTAASRRTR